MPTKKELEEKIKKLEREIDSLNSELENIVRNPKTEESVMDYLVVRGRIETEDSIYSELNTAKK